MRNLLDPILIPDRSEFDRIQSRDPAHAAAMLGAAREASRRSYACFLRYWLFATRAPFMWNWHWAYLADIMQAVADREEDVRFLIVNIPPRFAKSTLLSQMWQAWMLGREDSRRSSLFSITHTAGLAARDSRKTLEAVRSSWFKILFPQVTVGNRKETEMEWETDGGGYRLACGTGGQVTGRGADHLLVDDLIKAEDANSDQVREKANEWMGETLRNRLDDQKTGTITHIQQRLHERDATGYLKEEMKKPDADQYTHIVIPHEAPSRTTVEFRGVVYATREAKELLHPARIGPKEAAALRVAMRNNYSGQYQQEPTKMVGGHLDPRRLLRLQGSGLEIKSRLGLTPVAYIDFAATEKQTQKNDPDFSCIEFWARDQLGRLICLDVWKQQTSDYGVIARTLIHMHRLWRPQFVKGERGALLNLFQPVLRQQMQLIGHFLTLEPLPARRTDKVERSLPYQGALNAGLVGVPEAAPWLPEFEAEHRAFPLGAHDDSLDPAFDAATDYDHLPRGEVPTTHPDDPDAILQAEMHERIDKARERALAPDQTGEYDW
jgi:predicted phage terminase large subunit-like protein